MAHSISQALEEIRLHIREEIRKGLDPATIINNIQDRLDTLKTKLKNQQVDEQGNTVWHILCQGPLENESYNLLSLKQKQNEVLCYLALFDQFTDYQQLINNKNQDRQTPLHIAVQISQSVEIIDYLLSHKADVSSQDKLGNKPLHTLCQSRYRDYEIQKEVLFLLCKGDNDQHRANILLQTPLHILAAHPNPPLLEEFLRYSDDVNKPDIKGNTPLHEVLRTDILDKSTSEKARLLLEKGSNPDLPNYRFKTPRSLLEEEIFMGRGQELQRLFRNYPLHTCSLIGDEDRKIEDMIEDEKNLEIVWKSLTTNRSFKNSSFPYQELYDRYSAVYKYLTASFDHWVERVTVNQEYLAKDLRLLEDEIEKGYVQQREITLEISEGNHSADVSSLKNKEIELSDHRLFCFQMIKRASDIERIYYLQKRLLVRYREISAKKNSDHVQEPQVIIGDILSVMKDYDAIGFGGNPILKSTKRISIQGWAARFKIGSIHLQLRAKCTDSFDQQALMIVKNHGGVIPRGKAAVLELKFNNGDRSLLAASIIIDKENNETLFMSLISSYLHALTQFDTLNVKRVILPVVGAGERGWPVDAGLSMLCFAIRMYREFRDKTQQIQVINISAKDKAMAERYRNFLRKYNQEFENGLLGIIKREGSEDPRSFFKKLVSESCVEDIKKNPQLNQRLPKVEITFTESISPLLNAPQETPVNSVIPALRDAETTTEAVFTESISAVLNEPQETPVNSVIPALRDAEATTEAVTKYRYYSDDIDTYLDTIILYELGGYQTDCFYLMRQQFNENNDSYYVAVTPSVDTQSTPVLLASGGQVSGMPIDTIFTDRLGCNILDELITSDRMLAAENTRGKILIPFNQFSIHWLTAEIKIDKRGTQWNFEVFVHDPYGNIKDMWQDDFERIEKSIRSYMERRLSTGLILEITNEKSPYSRRQAYNDNTSCGVIVADDIIHRINGRALNGMHSVGALELRQNQLAAIEKYCESVRIKAFKKRVLGNENNSSLVMLKDLDSSALLSCLQNSITEVKNIRLRDLLQEHVTKCRDESSQDWITKLRSEVLTAIEIMLNQGASLEEDRFVIDKILNDLDHAVISTPAHEIRDYIRLNESQPAAECPPPLPPRPGVAAEVKDKLREQIRLFNPENLNAASQQNLKKVRQSIYGHSILRELKHNPLIDKAKQTLSDIEEDNSEWEDQPHCTENTENVVSVKKSGFFSQEQSTNDVSIQVSSGASPKI